MSTNHRKWPTNNISLDSMAGNYRHVLKCSYSNILTADKAKSRQGNHVIM